MTGTARDHGREAELQTAIILGGGVPLVLEAAEHELDAIALFFSALAAFG